MAWKDLPGVDNSEQILADIRDLLFIDVTAGSGNEHDLMVRRFIERRMTKEEDDT